VVIDGGAGEAAYAISTWDNERRIGFRWNGTDTAPIGNPQSRGLPTWTMLDEALHPAVIALAPEEKQPIISAYLNLPRKVELVVAWHSSGRRTLKVREGGRGIYQDLEGRFSPMVTRQNSTGQRRVKLPGGSVCQHVT